MHCESLTPTGGATRQSVHCKCLNPTRVATQQSVDCESLTPTQGATQRSGKQRGAKSEMDLSHPPSWGAQVGGNATPPLHCRGSPKKRGTKSEVAPLHVPSRGPTRGRKCYFTRAFSGIPKTKGDKIKSGYHTPAFSGAQKRAKTLRPCILAVPG